MNKDGVIILKPEDVVLWITAVSPSDLETFSEGTGAADNEHVAHQIVSSSKSKDPGFNIFETRIKACCEEHNLQFFKLGYGSGILIGDESSLQKVYEEQEETYHCDLVLVEDMKIFIERVRLEQQAEEEDMMLLNHGNEGFTLH